MKKILSILLALCVMISAICVMSVGTATSVSAATQYSNGVVEGGNILQCICWSYNTIRENLDDIKAAGYSAVQTSCIQPPKDYNPYDYTKDNVWWHFYQPVDLCVADGNNWLGTKAELAALCDAAHEKGMCIIADIVVNHMANPGSHGAYNGRSGEINPDLLYDESCWHNTGIALGGYDRPDMVLHDNSNQPDLNTSNEKVQNMVRDMLIEAIDCGVDGFRFDGAQNIETPRDDAAYNSMFWANVMDPTKNYAGAKGKTLFSYGEIYNDGWGGDLVLDDYIWYIGHVSEPNIGMGALGGVQGNDPSRVASVNYNNNRSAEKNVVWVESHDSYYNGAGYGGTRTSNISNDSIIRAWAIVGSRAGSTGMYFARPGSEYVTNASTDTAWKSTAVSEINKFKNYFRGQSEYLATADNVAYNERGNSGVVISKLDGEGSVNLTANRIASGTYVDQITGNTFTVANGRITGNVGSTGVAVVYNAPGDNPEPEEPGVEYTGATLTLEPGEWNSYGAWFAAYFYGSSGSVWLKMSGEGSTRTVGVPAGYDHVIFCRMSADDTSTLSWDNKWNQTDNLEVPAADGTYSITGWGDNTCPGEWKSDATETPTDEPTVLPSDEPSDDPTEAPGLDYTGKTLSLETGEWNSYGAWFAAYFYGSNGSVWLKMSGDGSTRTVGVPVGYDHVIFCRMSAEDGSTLSWDNRWDQTENLSIPDTDATYVISGWGVDTNVCPGEWKSDATEPPTDEPTEGPTEEPIIVPGVTYKVGDADNNGKVDIMDATRIQRILAGFRYDDVDTMKLRGAVTSASGKLSIVDATAIQRYLVGYGNAYGIGTIKSYS